MRFLLVRDSEMSPDAAGGELAGMADAKSHWERVYSSKKPTDVSWYQPHLRLSLELIQRSGITPEDPVIDVGGGASTLVDDLLDLGFHRVTALDISEKAIDVSRRRLGVRADRVRWIAEDVLRAALPAGGYRLWHDRAVFHFLTDAGDRAEYIRQLRSALSPGGFALIATFSPEGPQKCSGLEVCKYSPARLVQELGAGFTIIESASEAHQTPSNVTQAFQYTLVSYGG